MRSDFFDTRESDFRMPLDIIAGGAILVALILAWRCPKEKIPDLARALSRWLGHPDSSPHIGERGETHGIDVD